MNNFAMISAPFCLLFRLCASLITSILALFSCSSVPSQFSLSPRLPIATLLLTLITAGMFYADINPSLLYFEQSRIVDGELWRLVTGHFMHVDTNHLFWNSVGLIILGAIIERRSAKLLLFGVVAGLISVSLLLFSPFSTLQVYCGLSGVHNALLIIALWSEWKFRHHWTYPIIGLLAFLKILLELLLNQSIFSDVSWPPYPLAHLAGYLGGVLVVVAGLVRRDCSKN